VYTGGCDGVICGHSVDTGISFKVKGDDKIKGYSEAVHGGKVASLAVSAGVLLSVGWDDKLRLASVVTSADGTTSTTNTQEIALGAQPVAVSTHSPTGLAVVATRDHLQLYHGNTLLTSLTGLGYVPVSLDMVADEVAVGGEDNQTHVYSIAGRNAFTPITSLPSRSHITAVAYSPTGDRLAVGDAGRQIEVYSRGGDWTALIRGRWVSHTSRVTCLSWSPDGTHLASGSLDESIYVWRFADQTSNLYLPYVHVSGVTGLAWLGTDRLVSAGNDHCVVTWTRVTNF